MSYFWTNNSGSSGIDHWRRRETLILVAVALTLGIALANPASSQAQLPDILPDTTHQDEGPNPKGALWRAAILPGWGQIYNGHYLKLPVVYGALAGTAGFAIYFNERYHFYRQAYLFAAYEGLVSQGERESNPYAEYRSTYVRLIEQKGQLPTSTIRSARNNMRRNRDLTILGIAVAHAFSILDAYVSAHLAQFNVSEDLSFHLQPSTRGMQMTLRW